VALLSAYACTSGSTGAGDGPTASSSLAVWSSGGRNTSNQATGWMKVNGWTSDRSTATPAIAASSGHVHLAEVAGTTVWDLEWVDGSPTPTVRTLPPPTSQSAPSAPGIAHRGGGVFDMVVRGSDQFYHAYLLAGSNSWSSWEPLGGWGSEPSVTAGMIGGASTVDVWVLAGGSIWRRRWQWPGWQAWQEIGHPDGLTLATAPGVIQRADGTIDIVVGASGAGQLYHAYYSPSGVFSGWESIAGNTLVRPALSSANANKLDVWVKGASDGRIFHMAWDATLNPPSWSGYELTVNTVPNGTPPTFTTGPAAVDVGGVTTVAAVDSNGALLARSWMASVAAQLTAAPSTPIVRRPLGSLFVLPGGGENSSLVVGPNQGCGADGAVFVSAANGTLHRQPFSCVFNGTGATTQYGWSTCPDTQSWSLPAQGSNDNQIARMSNGKLMWVFQRGCVSTPTTRTGGQSLVRGVEDIFTLNNCATGNAWTKVATLDPCDPSGPFDATSCNTGAGATCSSSTPRTGADRPELLASVFDDSIYMSVGVAGAGRDNLTLMRAHTTDPSAWESMDTGQPTGGPALLAETPTHLYLARAEYGFPSNVGLYAYAKADPFDKASFRFVGNIAANDCAGIVSISLLNDANGNTVVRWIYPNAAGKIARGFSAVTPGGLVPLSSDSVGQYAIALPTLVGPRSPSDAAMLYWYERDATGTKWSVRASTSDGVGRWSTPVTLSSAAVIDPSTPADYMHGSYAIVGGATRFYAQWIQQVSGSGQELFEAVLP
jgi:hypothetical protein